MQAHLITLTIIAGLSVVVVPIAISMQVKSFFRYLKDRDDMLAYAERRHQETIACVLQSKGTP